MKHHGDSPAHDKSRSLLLNRYLQPYVTHPLFRRDRNRMSSLFRARNYKSPRPISAGYSHCFLHCGNLCSRFDYRPSIRLGRSIIGQIANNIFLNRLCSSFIHMRLLFKILYHARSLRSLEAQRTQSYRFFFFISLIFAINRGIIS
jgi:hypothetical protein